MVEVIITDGNGGFTMSEKAIHAHFVRKGWDKKYYIWIGEDGEWSPHMSFEEDEKDEALFEIHDLKCQGYDGGFGPSF
mgnify:CR=1 FL=1